MIERSEGIGKLAEALAKAQGEIKGAVKGAVNPHFKSRYADLESTWEACRVPLTKHGLSIIQMPFDNEGKIGVETILLHDSGEWVKGTIAVKMAQETNPQNAGSILTYLRRYSLQGAVGIAPEDDDGNAASGQQQAESAKPKAVSLDPGILESLRATESLDDLKKAWGAIPVGSRHAYTAEKDAAKDRIQKGAA